MVTKTAPRPIRPAADTPTVPPFSLPRSILNALPAAARIARLVQDIESLYPELERGLTEARTTGAVQLARAFVALHLLNQRMLSEEKAFKQFKALWKDTKENLVPQTFEQSGVDSIPLSEGFRVGISHRKVASIVPGMKLQAYEWLRDHDKGDVIQETVNASTLSALAKEMGEGNEELPEDLFKVSDLPNTSVTPTK